MRRRGFLLAAAGIGLTSACGSFTGTARRGRIAVDLAFAPTQGLSPYSDDGLLLSRLAVVDGLTRMDTEGVVHPALAEKWARTSATTWEFTLRDARFQDGGRVTADAVEGALTRAGRAKTQPRVLSDMRLTARAAGSGPYGSPRAPPTRCCPHGSRTRRSRSSPRPRTRRTAVSILSGPPPGPSR